MIFKQGYFKPVNVEKYVGNIDNIYYRSSYEYRFMTICDKSEKVLKWSSEPFRIPYYDEGNKKKREYVVDFWVEVLINNIIKKILIEIKPYVQTIAPIQPQKFTKKSRDRFLGEAKTFMTNGSKWKAANEYAKKLGWDFFIITEKNLNILK